MKRILIFTQHAGNLEAAVVASVFEQANAIAGQVLYELSYLDGTGASPYRVLRNGLLPGSKASFHKSSDILILDDRSISAREIHFAHLSKSICRMAGVGKGVFGLAASGLLDSREAVCHFADQCAGQRDYPDVKWRDDAIFASSDRIYTCAGGMAIADLALNWLEEDHGADLALHTAQRLLMHSWRSGHRAQLSLPLEGQFATCSKIRMLCEQIISHPERDWSVAEMARVTIMTERTLHRRFAQECGISPSRYVERVRVEHAIGLIDRKTDTLDHLANLVGLRDGQALRRAFIRVRGITPSAFLSSIGKSHDETVSLGAQCE